jgi:glucose-1-phosphate adenylyltransferase
LFAEWDVDQYLILSGDHLYRMNYADFIQRHRETKADVTISVVPMDEERASDFGLMTIDKVGRVRSFSEKPKGADLRAMRVDTTVLGLTSDEAAQAPYIASMGIYVFEKQVLHDLLNCDRERTDFGEKSFPTV